MRQEFEERHARLVASLRRLPDPQARLSWLVERGADITPLDPSQRIEAHEVRGCASRLWLVARCTGGRCHLRSDSESVILRALTGLLCRLYDGLPPAVVAGGEPDFLESEGLLPQLTENRRRTLKRFRDAVRDFARQASSDSPASS